MKPGNTSSELRIVYFLLFSTKETISSHHNEIYGQRGKEGGIYGGVVGLGMAGVGL